MTLCSGAIGPRMKSFKRSQERRNASAIKVAALATANESFIGNQSISLPFIRQSCNLKSI